MIPEIGHFALILALSLALLQGILPMIGAHRNDAAMMGTARTAAVGHLFGHPAHVLRVHGVVGGANDQGGPGSKRNLGLHP